MLDPIGDPAKRVDIANVGLERRSMPAVVLLMRSTVSSSSASVAGAETVIMLRSDARPTVLSELGRLPSDASVHGDVDLADSGIASEGYPAQRKRRCGRHLGATLQIREE